MSKYYFEVENKDNYWFKLNHNNLNLSSNSLSKVTNGSEIIESYVIYDINNLKNLNVEEKIMVSVTGIVRNIKSSSFNSNRITKFKLVDVNYTYSIECIFWNFDNILEEFKQYDFFYVLLDNNDGLQLRKSAFTIIEYADFTANKNDIIQTNLINLTSTSINSPLIQNWNIAKTSDCKTVKMKGNHKNNKSK